MFELTGIGLDIIEKLHLRLLYTRKIQQSQRHEWQDICIIWTEHPENRLSVVHTDKTFEIKSPNSEYSPTGSMKNDYIEKRKKKLQHDFQHIFLKEDGMKKTYV